MVLVLFFCLLIIFAVFSLKIRIEIKNIKISNLEKKEHLLKEIDLYIKLYIFGVLKIFQKHIDLEEINNAKESNLINKFKSRFKENNKLKSKELLNVLKKLNIDFKEIDLNVNIGTEDPILTSFIIFVISIGVSVILSKFIKKFDSRRYKYSIMPIYNNKNFINVSNFSIVDFKLVNIISIIFKLMHRSGKYDKQSSNRESDDYCDEQYRADDRCKYNCRGTN